MRKRLAPIRQGEGVSRTISGNSKERSVLWRVFLHTLSSREERVCPRRASPFVKRFVSSGKRTAPTTDHYFFVCPPEHPLHPPQLPPQEDFPLFLSRIMLRMIAPQITISTSVITMVERLPISHSSIAVPPNLQNGIPNAHRNANCTSGALS